MGKIEGTSVPEASPDALEALAAAERKETEELLSGFDRPQRTPRRAEGAPSSRRIAAPKKQATQSSAKWIAAAVLAFLVVTVGTVAWVLTPARVAPAAGVVGTPASVFPVEPVASPEPVPAPEPEPEPPPVVAAPKPAARKETKAPRAAETKSQVRTDFVRDL